MIKNNIKRNIKKQIKKLKKDLMPKTKGIKSGSVSSKFSKEFNKIKNSEIDEIFENNIRETLMFEYNFHEGNIKRHFFLRTLTFDEKEQFLLINEPKDVKINNKGYSFILNNDDKSVNIIEESGKIFKTIKSNKKINVPIEEENVEIGKITEVEFDGSFECDNSAFEKFNKDEVITLFSNVTSSQINLFNYVIMEIKLNKGKIAELIKQLLKDKQIIEKIYSNKKFLYVGFINSKELDVDISSKIGDLNIIIYGLKKNVFGSRDIKNEITELKNILLVKKRKREEINDKENDKGNDECN